MSGTEETFHYTNEDIRKLESRESKIHGGSSIIDTKTQPKEEIIAERQANLPLPEQPPVASDWDSADGRNVNVGSGRVSSDVSHGAGSESGLRGPATGDSSVRTDGGQLKTSTADLSGVGRQGKDNLDGLPKDALAK